MSAATRRQRAERNSARASTEQYRSRPVTWREWLSDMIASIGHDDEWIGCAECWTDCVSRTRERGARRASHLLSARLRKLYRRRAPLISQDVNGPPLSPRQAARLRKIEAELDALEYERMRPALEAMERYAEKLEQYAEKPKREGRA